MKIPFFLLIFILCVSPVHARIYAQKDVTFINKVAYDTNQQPITGQVKKEIGPDGYVLNTYKDGRQDGLQQQFHNNRLFSEYTMTPDGINGFVKTYHSNGRPELITPFVNGKREGLAKHYDEDGHLLSEETYVNDQLNGKQTFYYPSGQPKKEAMYQNGVLNGSLKTYYETGELESEMTNENGLTVGLYTEYWKNGRAKSEGLYEKDVLVHLKEYYEDGTLKSDTAYQDKKPHGVSTHYYPNGVIQNIRLFRNGKLVGEKKNWIDLRPQNVSKATPGSYALTEVTMKEDTVYDLNNQPVTGTLQLFKAKNGVRLDIPLINGKAEGIARGFYPDGALESETPYTNNKKNGIGKEYYPSGALKSEGTYIDGKMEGDFRTYYENGQLETVFPFKANVLNGTGKTYNENGQIASVHTFQNGAENSIGKFYNPDGTLSYMKEGEKILSLDKPCGTDMCYTQRTIDGILVYEMRPCAAGEKSPYEAPCPTPASSGQEICVEKIKQPDGFVIEREYPCPW